MVFKRKQIVVGAMVLLIGAAGYLNWSYDTTGGEIASVDKSDEYVPIGEAQMVFNSERSSENQNKNNNENTLPSKSSSESDKQTNKSGESEKNDESNNEAKNFTLSQSKLDRDNSRSKEISLLKSTLMTSGSTEDSKSAAQQKILSIADAMDKEESIESMISAKGLGDSVVYISDEAVNVVSALSELNASQTAQIREIVYDFTQNNNIKIVELNK